METELYTRDFHERAIRAMNDRFVVPGPIAGLSQLVTEQEATAHAAPVELSADARRLQATFERDGKVLGERISTASEAIHRRWVPTRDTAPGALRDQLHFFGADHAGVGGPWVYRLAWGLIEGGGGGAGIGVNTSVRDGTFSASHFTHGSNQLSSYAGIGVVMVPSLDQCMLSVRPLVNWSGFDILSHRVFDPQLNPRGWGVAGAQIGVIVQSWDLSGGSFRNDQAPWVTVWQRSEINPSGSRNYNDTVDSRSLHAEVFASSQRQYAIWVACRAFVITQAKFGLDIWASASVSCQLPYLVVEEVVL